MDEMVLNSGVFTWIIAKFIRRYVKKKFGVDVDLTLEDVHVINKNDKTVGSAKVMFAIASNDVPKLIFKEDKE